MSMVIRIGERIGIAARPWVQPRLGRRWLVLMAVVSIGLWQATEHLVRVPAHPRQDVLVAAARTALRAQQEIARAKEAKGLLQPAAIDPNRTGLIGPDWSEITTTIGDLQAKRTVTNPDLAAALARILITLKPHPGAAVGLILSGSFVGANIAAIAAVESLGLRPVIISSIGASMFGATDPDFTWLDMEATIARAGIWQARSTTVVLGGESALGNSLSAAGQDMLVAAARRNGHEPLNAAQFENLKPKATLALAEAAPGGLVALVSSGGSVLALGTCVDAYRVPTGVVLGRLPCEGGVPGLIHDFAARGIPVVHILNVKRLALEWGLPLDPKPLPSIGQNARVYGPAAFAKSN